MVAFFSTFCFKLLKPPTTENIWLLILECSVKATVDHQE